MNILLPLPKSHLPIPTYFIRRIDKNSLHTPLLHILHSMTQQRKTYTSTSMSFIYSDAAYNSRLEG